jgi:UDP:flavonoid glycosyltransferase YjiC (YdhE family)
MMLASFVGGWGHAEPLLPVARAAAGRGQRVVFAGQAAIVPRLESVGFDTVVVGPDTLSAARKPLVPVDRDMERTVARDHFIGSFGRRRASHLDAVIAGQRADVVLCDEMDAGAVVAAERAGIPCITVGVIAAGRLTAPEVIGAAWSRLRSDAGLDVDPGCERFGGTVRLDPSPASFRDPTVPCPFDLRHVRPPVLDVVEPSRPPPGLVYATLGTVFDVESGDLFPRVATALALLEHESLLTIGATVRRDELPATPAHVRIEAYVPQAEVLGRCRAVVCHGGSGTLVAALSLGVPVVVLPMGADQPDNADRCHDLGVGIVLDPITATPHEIADAVDTVSNDPRYRLAAQRLADEAAQQPHPTEIGAVIDVL